ncbi:MAG TPA: fumarate/nitrate reduction transcriptional regulator Fnr [Thiotrichales bacterium]|nr:fumarate/nitrate reduction transcriptional regulator Fnr [Thiotrichales bacterium]
MNPPDPKVADLAEVQTACEQCGLHQLCLPLDLAQEDIAALDKIIHHRKPLHRGDFLFQVGDPFRAIYAVRSGSIKTFTSTDSGEEQVTGFHLPSEIVGLDAITTHRHPCSAQALETTSVCEIPFDRLEELGHKIPGLQRQMLRIMSREILDDQNTMIWLGKKSADERLAALLLRISSRFAERGFSATEFNLSMSRTDIANYLGLAVETVSRLFSRFQQEGLVTVERRHVIIQDLDRLRALAGGQGFSD